MNREHVASVVKKHIAEAVDGVLESDIDSERSLTSYGASSLDIVSIVSGAMRELKVRIPRTELKNIQNIQGLIDLFAASTPI
jgi:acyl carrier protein